MQKTLYLLRHCLTHDSERGINGSQTDTPLSPDGEQAAQQLVSVLSQQVFDVIIVSPLQRTQQTIAPYVNSLLNKPPIIVENLTIERNLGVYTNTHEGDGLILADIHSSGKSRTEWIPENGESTVQVFARAKQFLSELVEKSETNILICGHQNFLRCLELTLRNESIDDANYYSTNPPMLKYGEMRMYTFSN